MPKINEQFGHYKIISVLGAGGMGQVYLALDTKLDRRIALKFLNEDLSRDANKLKRFIQEAKAASALNHPNILTVYEIGEIDRKHYIATELIEGRTLRDHLVAKEPISLETILKIGIQIAEALAAAHDAGIIHRDIKPENVMIRKDGYVKVLDFGLAKLIEKKRSDKGLVNGEIHSLVTTTPGVLLGTVAYMSPEQARGKTVDIRTDIFSLGVILYELLTHRQPFIGETISHTIVAILEKEPPPMSSIISRIPLELEKIVLRALAKDTAHRYQNAAELITDLKAIKKRFEFEAELERAPSLHNIYDNTVMIFNSNRQEIAPANTIAVLPFVNMSPNEDGDYFSDGLAEELLNVLSKISGLRVAARTSAFSFKGKRTTIAEIGKTLNVASVLEGSIRMAGNRVRIAVQLVNVADGYHLWSETYDRTMDDIFAVQDDIAQSVVEELRSRLLGEDVPSSMNKKIISEVARAVKGRAENPEAQRLMLMGRHFLDRTTREDTAKAIVYFQQALKLDPGFALCWAELGRAYSIEAGRAWVNVEQGFKRSREATERALLMEPNLAEGHAQLGRIQITHDWDFHAAESSFRQAMNLAPGSSSVLDGASILAYKLGRFPEALELSRRVLAQDPLSAAFWHNLGLTCHAADLLEESEEAFRRALELVPHRFVSSALLALVLMDQGRTDDAMAEAMNESDEFWKLWSLVILHYTAGLISESDEALGKLLEHHSEGNSFQIAEMHSMRGEIDLAFKWLESAFEQRDPGITHTRVNPRFRPLQQDSRWLPLLKKIGFEV